ncbi:aggregation-promoting factor C-terminal-like domain-containing protein [Microbacterium resistens]
MPETLSPTPALRRTETARRRAHSRAHRTTAALTVAFGVALGTAASLGLSAVAPAAAADPLSRAAAASPSFDTARQELRAALAESDAVLTDATTAVIEVQNSGLDLAAQSAAVDIDGLKSVRSAAEEADVSSTRGGTVTASLRDRAQAVAAQAATLRTQLATAVSEKQAAEAAAAALAEANTPDGARAAAQQIAADEYGWGGDQFQCLSSLWQKESGWDYQAYNPSGATGIPQSLPGDKMASAGDDWETNAVTQIRWGLGYIQSVYGTPCAAWGHSQATNWY